MEHKFIDRINVWQETKAAATVIAGVVPPSEKLTPTDFSPNTVLLRGFTTDVSIENVDCIEAGLAMAAEGLNPVVLLIAMPVDVLISDQEPKKRVYGGARHSVSPNSRASIHLLAQKPSIRQQCLCCVARK